MNATTKHETVRIAMTINELAQSVGCGRASAKKIAADAGAIFYIGRRPFADVDRVKKHIETLVK